MIDDLTAEYARQRAEYALRLHLAGREISAFTAAYLALTNISAGRVPELPAGDQGNGTLRMEKATA